MNFLRLIMFALFIISANKSVSASDLPNDRATTIEVSLVVHQGRDVHSNIIRANLVSTATGKNWSLLSKNTLNSMDEIIKKIESDKKIDVISGAITTSIVGTPDGVDDTPKTSIFWKIDRHFFLITENSEALFPILSDHIPGVIVRNIEYSLSKARQETAEREVTSLAMSELNRRAEILRETVGASSFSIVSMNLDTRLRLPKAPVLSQEQISKNISPIEGPTVSNVSSTISARIVLDR